MEFFFFLILICFVLVFGCVCMCLCVCVSVCECVCVLLLLFLFVCCCFLFFCCFFFFLGGGGALFSILPYGYHLDLCTQSCLSVWFYRDSWTDMFNDAESGLDFYVLTIGSRPGHDDIMLGQRGSTDCGVFTTDVSMINGHAYYVTIGVSERQPVDKKYPRSS